MGEVAPRETMVPFCQTANDALPVFLVIGQMTQAVPLACVFAQPFFADCSELGPTRARTMPTRLTTFFGVAALRTMTAWA